MRRVVVTGIGAVAPSGNNFNDSWSSIKNGHPSISGITKFDAKKYPWNMAGEIKSFEPLLFLSQKETKTMDVFVQYAVAAAVMAARDAGLHTDNNFSPDDSGVIIGSSRGGIGSIEREFNRLYARIGKDSVSRLSPYLMPSSTIGIAASCVAQKLNIKGKCIGISCACSSGAVSIGEAYRAIKDGYSRVILAGGAEAPICEICLAGYGSSGALSSIRDASASRPFANGRDGFVLSEGATVLVLEEYESAVKRNVNIYGEIVGYSNTSDAFHITQPALEGEVKTMCLALKDAGILPEEVDYINAHATSTPIGDRVEAEAIRMVFIKNPEIPVSSIKSMTGHMLAASGAYEIACSLMSLKEGIIPPTINLADKAPECNINVITELTAAPLKVALSNSFGFGGVNASLVIRRVESGNRN